MMQPACVRGGDADVSPDLCTSVDEELARAETVQASGEVQDGFVIVVRLVDILSVRQKISVFFGGGGGDAGHCKIK